MIQARIVNWSPAPYAAPRAVLSQAASGPSATDQALASPTMAFVTDLAAASIGGFLAYGYGKKNPGRVNFWLVVTTAAVIKAFHDFKRISSKEGA